MDFALGQLVDIRPNEQRALGHAKEDVGCGRHAFANSGAQDLLQDPAQFDHHPLHCTHVVQDGDEEAEEEDSRQDGEGEHIIVHQEVAEHELGSIGGIAQKRGHLVAQALEDFSSHLPADAENAEQKLARDSRDDYAPINGSSIRGENVAAQDEEAGCHQGHQFLGLVPALEVQKDGQKGQEQCDAGQ